MGIIQTWTLLESLSFPAKIDLTATDSNLGTRGVEHLAESHCLCLLLTDLSMASVLGHNETSVTKDSALHIDHWHQVPGDWECGGVWGREAQDMISSGRATDTVLFPDQS